MNVLALVNGTALAHVSRALEVAKDLRERGHQVELAGGGGYLRFAAQDGFSSTELPFLSDEHVYRTTKSGRMDRIFRGADLAGWVNADLELMRRSRAQVVLVDNRLTSPTAAQVAGLPCVSMMNVHMSRFREVPFYSLRHVLPWLPKGALSAADRLENRSEQFVYHHAIVMPLNEVRVKLGLAPRYGPEMEEGDWTLFPDIPAFNPALSPRPPQVGFVGPITWHPPTPAPACLARLDPQRPTVYLSLGSGGLVDLAKNLESLRDPSLQFVLALGNHGELPPAPDNVFLEPFVNTDLLLPHCDAVVCHGGNGTLYQALAHGLPVVGFATHAEQYYGLKRLRDLGLGLGFRDKVLMKGGWGNVIRRTALQVLQDERCQRATADFAERMKAWNGVRRAADIVERAGGVSSQQGPLTTPGEDSFHS